MEQPKVPLEVALEISLDEYIALCGIDNPQLRPNMILMNKNKYSNQQNRHNKNETINDDDEVMIDFDITEIPKPSSQQWRLKPPNNLNHPPGMPPLVPLQAEFLHNALRKKKNKKKNSYNYRKNQDTNLSNVNKRNTTNWNQTNRKKKYNSNNRNVRSEPYNNKNCKWNCGEMDRSNGYNNSNIRMSNIQDRMTMPKIHNGFIPKNLSEINNQTFECRIPSLQTTNVTKINEMALQPVNNNIVGENFIKNCFEMMPAIANKILEQLQAQKINENKYDMSIQKEISDIQGKSLMFKCPGAGVISFDGPGIDCSTINHQTNVSMNQRFA